MDQLKKSLVRLPDAQLYKLATDHGLRSRAIKLEVEVDDRGVPNGTTKTMRSGYDFSEEDDTPMVAPTPAAAQVQPRDGVEQEIAEQPAPIIRKFITI